MNSCRLSSQTGFGPWVSSGRVEEKSSKGAPSKPFGSARQWQSDDDDDIACEREGPLDGNLRYCTTGLHSYIRLNTFPLALLLSFSFCPLEAWRPPAPLSSSPALFLPFFSGANVTSFSPTTPLRVPRLPPTSRCLAGRLEARSPKDLLCRFFCFLKSFVEDETRICGSLLRPCCWRNLLPFPLPVFFWYEALPMRFRGSSTSSRSLLCRWRALSAVASASASSSPLSSSSSSSSEPRRSSSSSSSTAVRPRFLPSPPGAGAVDGLSIANSRLVSSISKSSFSKIALKRSSMRGFSALSAATSASASSAAALGASLQFLGKPSGLVVAGSFVQ
ncbi:hypothetical protein KC340_g95 [Hortaea werneckii]|nr:hypothetical protein KC340_g95 [Hortaea werneckii]